MNFDLSTMHVDKDFLIVEVNVTCDGEELCESEAITVEELKVLSQQLKDAVWLLDGHIEDMGKDENE